MYKLLSWKASYLRTQQTMNWSLDGKCLHIQVQNSQGPLGGVDHTKGHPKEESQDLGGQTLAPHQEGLQQGGQVYLVDRPRLLIRKPSGPGL